MDCPQGVDSGQPGGIGSQANKLLNDLEFNHDLTLEAIFHPSSYNS